ncbi:carbohydrate sulfotransferase 1-like [Glandiceps talaboti]
MIDRLVLRRSNHDRVAVEIRSDGMSTGAAEVDDEYRMTYMKENTRIPTSRNSGYRRKVAGMNPDWPGLSVSPFERSGDPNLDTPNVDIREKSNYAPTGILQGLRKLEDQLLRIKNGIDIDRPTLSGYREFKNLNPTKLKFSERTNVVVTAGMRTGSSFVGQLFNSHPDFFFLFEPLFGLRSMENGPEISVHGVRALYKIYNCDFYVHGMDEYFNWYNGLFRWQRDERCHTLDRYDANMCCTRARNVAVKTIRIMDVRDFISLMQDPSVNLKVIVVVRDPRAMMASLMPVYQAGYNYDPVIASMHQYVENLDGVLLDRLKHYCDVNLRNYILAKTSNEAIVPWKKNVMVVRFEDIALYPVQLAKQIYDFVGPNVDIHSDVLRWIHNNTKEDTDPDYTNGNYGFENKRNSTQVTDKWRHKLSFDLVAVIQNTGVCQQYMHALGYLPVFESYELHDNSIELFDKSRRYSSL